MRAETVFAPSGVEDPGPPEPRVPESLSDTGLSEDQVSELLLKILDQRGALGGSELADVIALPYGLLDDVLLTLQQRYFVEVLNATGHGRSGYTYSLTAQGRDRARAALDTSRYVGAAPVPLEQFSSWMAAQSIRDVTVRREELSRAFSDLVLPEGLIESLGPALNSGGSIFLHGAPGNGKTAIAERVGSITSSTMFLPRALLVHGHVVVLYDPVYHRLKQEEQPTSSSPLFRAGPTWDRRFVQVRRPTVFVGGELTMDQLDLQFDPYSKVYQAPFQLKAIGGVLVIDDFGRQRVRPEEILNRWIVPLEKGRDNLTLHTGIRFPVPFDSIVIFATNLNPRALVDEAFLRRIQYKVEMRSPDRGALSRIFEMNCEQMDVPFDPAALDLLYEEYYEPMGIAPRGCHPRDLLHQIRSRAVYEGYEATLEPTLLRQAAHSYFLVMEEEYQAGVGTVAAHGGD